MVKKKAVVVVERVRAHEARAVLNRDVGSPSTGPRNLLQEASGVAGDPAPVDVPRTKRPHNDFAPTTSVAPTTIRAAMAGSAKVETVDCAR